MVEPEEHPKSVYVSAEALAEALRDLRGTADHLLKIWLTLKHMGMRPNHAVEVDTSNSTESLQAVFGCGDPAGRFFVPFAHTRRYLTMAPDASRSIVQTTIRRWLTSGSVVTVDPTGFLDISETDGGRLRVETSRNYPEGLGFAKNGFALEDGSRTAVPRLAFAIWYYRQAPLPDDGESLGTHLLRKLSEDFHLSPVELELVFVDDADRTITTSAKALTDAEIFTLTRALIDGEYPTAEVLQQTYKDHVMEVRQMVSSTYGRPAWLLEDPAEVLADVLQGGATAVLLYGPPRTGKTRAIDQVLAGRTVTRIQIHNGWGYDDLMVGLRPARDGSWEQVHGPLLEAIHAGVDFVVLEEINRTDFTQAIGEVFSLIEDAYRGPDHGIRLRNGESFHIPKELVFLCTMNTLDRSTENIDDALFGRMTAIEFPPRVEVLGEMLEQAGVPLSKSWMALFAHLREIHPIGHGYFADLRPTDDPIRFYKTRIRPVLQKHLAGYREEDLHSVDEKIEQLFGG